MGDGLLQIEDLTVTFETDEGRFDAVDNVSLHVAPNEIVGLVGESGCGKSVTALSILRLIPSPVGRITKGSIFFQGNDLLQLGPKEMRRIRGRAISMIFQEPSTALSPLHRIGDQMAETLLLHTDTPRDEAWTVSENWLEKVRIPDARDRMLSYPFQLSGGMQQRVMIAMAMILGPDLIIADEPTTALDVTTQAQIFRLIREMRRQRSAILLITHDMGVVWEMCDRVVVMYASRIVEEGGRGDIFDRAFHPYTRGLLRSIPKLTENPGRLKAISGQVPSPFHYPSGCRFRDRCPHAFDRCKSETPRFYNLGDAHRAACFLADR
jgi:peptide/nickel transport system ATP-binding protein/oligopeptide transport system ATP-binding protein